MIRFNEAPYIGKEFSYIEKAIRSGKLSGGGEFTDLCQKWLQEKCGDSAGVLLTTSCTHAMELAAMLVDIKEGDEIIMPSFTFVSTATAFVQRGARIVFVDIRPDTLNINETRIESAITNRTKTIVPMHYAGVGCEMDEISTIASAYKIAVIEDAAQGVMAKYKGKGLGSIGDFGCFSFHDTKNFTMGEGGAIVIKDAALYEKAEIFREKGTDRSKFFRGMVDKYTWVDKGSSYIPSELNAAYLYPQLLEADLIIKDRMASWELYHSLLSPLAEQGIIKLPDIPEYCAHNAHMFYIRTKSFKERASLISFLGDRDITAVFHYIPLHTSPAGKKYGRFNGTDEFTTYESERVLRLPLFYGLSAENVRYIADSIIEFYS